MDPRWRIELLGQLRLCRGDGAATPLQRQKATLLLAYLAYHIRHPHPREALTELLWPEADPEEGRRRLRYQLHVLRGLLGRPGSPAETLLIAERTTVSLDPAAFTTDVAEFHAALRDVDRAASLHERVRGLAAAVAGYPGELLPGYYDPWVLTERQVLAELQLDALRQLLAAREETGDLEGALAAARQAVRSEPLLEEAHYDVMRLAAALGQSSAALRQFQELERLLREELDETPSAQVRALAEELRHSSRSLVVARSQVTSRGSRVAGRESTVPETGLATREPRPATRDPRPAPMTDDEPLVIDDPETITPSPSRELPPPRLPAQLSRFFGRHEEIDWITRTLSSPDVRLVTLTGPGGTGKTRLAITVAEQLLDTWWGAVWFVPLADVAPPAPGAEGARDRIAAAIAAAMGLAPSAEESPVGQIVEAAGRRPTLLVLDNFEHLVEEGAPVVRALLERVSSLTCLVTSRQHLDLTGEQEFAVLPLPTPGPSVQAFRRSGVQEGVGEGPGTVSGQWTNAGTPNARTPERLSALSPEHLMRFPGVQLFVDRARAVRPGFQLDEKNAAAVAALCDRLEGLPLAIELAAAWVRSLTPAQILQRLSRRFDLLAGHRRDVEARHQSLRAAIEWSYQLLAPEHRRLFAHLSVFRGGWTLAAAEAVCGEEGVRRWALGLRPDESVPPAQGLRPNAQRPRPSAQGLRPDDVLNLLTSLVDKSLVVAEEAGEEMRYHLLESLREFAAEQVAPAERRALVRRHAAFFLTLAESADRGSNSEDGADRLQEVEREYDNLRAGLDGCLQSDPSPDAAAVTEDVELGLALGAALGSFWITRCHFAEGRRYLTALLARSEATVSHARARALSSRARITYPISSRGLGRMV